MMKKSHDCNSPKMVTSLHAAATLLFEYEPKHASSTDAQC